MNKECLQYEKSTLVVENKPSVLITSKAISSSLAAGVFLFFISLHQNVWRKGFLKVLKFESFSGCQVKSFSSNYHAQLNAQAEKVLGGVSS